jgi:hypothetical protein
LDSRWAALVNKVTALELCETKIQKGAGADIIKGNSIKEHSQEAHEEKF